MSVVAVMVTTTVGCSTAASNEDDPTTRPVVPEATSAAVIGTSAGELVRVTGTILEGAEEGCLLLEGGGTRYALVGGQQGSLNVDDEITVTGYANPSTPSPCAEGIPLTVAEIGPAA
jgi:hypothetical protein